MISQPDQESFFSIIDTSFLSTELYYIMCACIMKTTTEANKDDITRQK